jgi:hypothetical protein
MNISHKIEVNQKNILLHILGVTKIWPRMSLCILFFLILLFVFSANIFAEIGSNEQIDYSEIEAQERLKIISELTYRLDTKSTCVQTLNWDDGGTGADLDGYFYIPVVGQSEYIIGGYASGKEKTSNSCVLTVSEPANNPQGTPNLLVSPMDWKQIWKDKGSGAKKDGSMWEAIPPGSNYKCLGSIPQPEYDQKPRLPNYRCVHSSLTEKIVTNALIWSDKGSGANKEVTMFALPNTGSFITVGARVSEIETYDLKANAAGTPGPELVEEKLAIRMEKNQQVLKAQNKVDLEQEKPVEDEPKNQVEEKEHAEAVATSTPIATKDETISSSPSSPSVSENQKSESSHFTNLARRVTGWLGNSSSGSTTTSSSSSTIGIRGLGAEELRTAHPDTEALQKMDGFVSNTSDAAGFANKALLVAQNVEYLEAVSMDKPEPTTIK